jgi:hypothetical protein
LTPKVNVIPVVTCFIKLKTTLLDPVLTTQGI